METADKTKAVFDPLDMGNYKVEKLPKMQKSKFEIWMARLGGPLAIAAFVWICWFCHIGFIDNLNTEMLTEKADLEAKLSSGTLSATELQTASTRYGELQGILDEKELRWLELSEI